MMAYIVILELPVAYQQWHKADFIVCTEVAVVAGPETKQNIHVNYKLNRATEWVCHSVRIKFKRHLHYFL